MDTLRIILEVNRAAFSVDIVGLSADWVKAIAAVVTAVVAVVTAVVGYIQYRRGLYLKMRQEYGTQGIQQRETFWKSIIALFMNFYAENGKTLTERTARERLFNLIHENEPFPIPERNVSLQDHMLIHEQRLKQTEVGAEFYSFLQWIYSNSQSCANLKCKLNSSRSRLSDFWERWLDRFWLLARKRRIVREYHKEYECITLLSWLDAVHRSETNEFHLGKRRMYQLAANMKKHNRTLRNRQSASRVDPRLSLDV